MSASSCSLLICGNIAAVRQESHLSNCPNFPSQLYTLTGGADADTFVLLEELNSEAAVIGVFRDTITDFQVGIDILQFNATALALLDGFVFDADGFGEGEQGENFLVVGNGAVADQAYAQMLFDMTTGVLSIDADGTGESEAVFIGTIGAGLSLTANDFLFVIPEA